MNISRPLLLVSGTLLSLAVYGLAVWGETARNAEGLGFNERFGIDRLVDGSGKVGVRQFKDLRFEVWEYLSLGGMLVLLIATLAGAGRVSKWIPAAYLGILTVLGGWKGLLMVIFLPLFLFNLVSDPLPMDGEFFADSVARHMGAGVWLLLLLVWSLSGFIRWRPRWMRPPRPRHYI
ncbi:MAG: hypothetical protein EOP84_29795 [Verrucomicrobiaceae bacterium]|nr:MAG: hypothetical protein EOP84_29795 [Verrucomicrobiaceae bacterium]